MDQHPIILIIGICILMMAVLFPYLGGTFFILVSSWVPLRTRLRWAAASVIPLVLLLPPTAIYAVFHGKGMKASGAIVRNTDVLFSPSFLVLGLVVVGVIVANWVIFRRFRAAFPHASKSSITLLRVFAAISGFALVAFALAGDLTPSAYPAEAVSTSVRIAVVGSYLLASVGFLSYVFVPVDLMARSARLRVPCIGALLVTAATGLYLLLTADDDGMATFFLVGTVVATCCAVELARKKDGNA